MKLLFMLTLTMLPLLSLSQNPQKDIERLNKDSFKISNDAAQAHHFLIIQRDSLLNNNDLLRKAVDSLNKRNKRLVDKIFNIADQQSKALSSQSKAIKNQEKATEDLSKANSFITDYWKDISDNSHLSTSIITDLTQFSSYRLQINLSIPVSGKFSIIARPIYTNLQKPVYLIGLNYRLF